MILTEDMAYGRTLKDHENDVGLRMVEIWMDLTNWIVQAERLVSSAPLVADSRQLLHDECRDAHNFQSSCDVKAALSTPDDDDCGFHVLEIEFAPALFRPLTGIREPVAQESDMFRETFEFLEIGVDCIRFPLSG